MKESNLGPHEMTDGGWRRIHLAMGIFPINLNRPSPTNFSFIFGQTIQCLQQMNVKNVHTVHGAGLGFEPTTS